jgi:hypothetical protein
MDSYLIKILIIIRRRRLGFQAFFRKAWKKNPTNPVNPVQNKPLINIRIHSYRQAMQELP